MQVDYKGKCVFVGIDVHKKSYSVVSICDGELVKKDRLVSSPEGLVDYLKKYFPAGKIMSAYEAGFSGFELHRYLLSQGIHNLVVHAASIEISSRDRVKTDKRDALKIAMQLSANRLKGIYVPSREQEARRRLSRLREELVNDRRRIGNRLKSLLYILGYSFPEDRKISRKWLKALSKETFDEETRYVFELQYQRWLLLGKEIKCVKEELKKQAKQDEALEKVYQSAPGIGEIHARILANELGDMSQFSHEKKLFSYIGLTPSEYSSGEHRWLGHISRQGKSLLRKVLIQATWKAIEKDKHLREAFERIARRSGKKRAIVACARKLIGRIRACFVYKQAYSFA